MKILGYELKKAENEPLGDITMSFRLPVSLRIDFYNKCRDDDVRMSNKLRSLIREYIGGN